MNIYIKRRCKVIKHDDEFGNTIKYWLNDKGQIHREDGPAMVFIDGSNKGSEQWYLNNKQHRENGPAAVWYWNDHIYTIEHFLDGIYYTQRVGNEAYSEAVKRRKAAKENT